MKKGECLSNSENSSSHLIVRKEDVHMDEIYAIRRFVPGQIWNLVVDTQSLDGSHVKARPYLVIGANNRRVTLLKMTTGGNYASNWIYTIKNGGDREDTNIILDCPIVATIRDIEIISNWATMSDALFKRIYEQHIAAMLSQSRPEFIKDDEFVKNVINIIETHDDRLLSYSIYTKQYGIEHEELDDNDDDETYELDLEPDEDQSEITEPEPESVETTPEIVEPESEIEVTETRHELGSKPVKRNPRVDDLFVIGIGSTKDEKLYAACESIGIPRNTARMQLGTLVANKKIGYANNRYKLTLKSDLAIKDYRRQLCIDSDTFGNIITGKMWGVTPNYVSKIKSGVKNGKLKIV